MPRRGDDPQGAASHVWKCSTFNGRRRRRTSKKLTRKKKYVWRATLYLKVEIFFQTFWYQKDEGKLPQKAATFTTN